MPIFNQVSSISDVLKARASSQPEQIAYIFLVQGQIRHKITYQQLDRKARIIAAALQTKDLLNQPVPLLFNNSIEYLEAFFGCLYAGAIAVPLYIPSKKRHDRRVEVILRDTKASVVLSDPGVSHFDGYQLEKLPELMHFDDTLSYQPESYQEIITQPKDIAFLQYTSGTTSDPKGVIVTHGNIMANEYAIKHSFDHDEQSIFVSWTPIFHDMGLIGNILQPLYIGSTCIFMQPAEFIKNPSLWLKAISDFKAHTAGGPNFAFDLCLHKVDPEILHGLDLSSWKVAFNGAEVVQAETMRKFADKFGPFGFKFTSFLPCYGLAEATLLASAIGSKQAPTAQWLTKSGLSHGRVEKSLIKPEKNVEGTFRELVSCGELALGVSALIINENGEECVSGQEIGEIWLSGPNISSGYWNNAKATNDAFVMRSVNGVPTSFFKTGDLGYLENNTLFVTGRNKDMIIIRGENYYPQDIELCIANALNETGQIAAFSVFSAGQESLVVAIEISKGKSAEELIQIQQQVNKAILLDCQLVPLDIVLVRKRSLPMTTSGKIQRNLCKKRYLEGEIERFNSPQNAVKESTDVKIVNGKLENRMPVSTLAAVINSVNDPAVMLEMIKVYLQTEITAQLQKESNEMLVVKPDLLMPIAELGADSLVLAGIASVIEQDLNVSIDFVELLNDISISELANKLTNLLFAKKTITKTISDERLINRSLSFGQAGLFYLQSLDKNYVTYNIAEAFVLDSGFDLNKFTKAMQYLIDKYENLRTYIKYENAQPQLGILNSLPFEPKTVAVESHNALEMFIDKEVHTAFNLLAAPLFRITVYSLSNGSEKSSKSVILFCFHHILMDNHSFRLLFNELNHILRYPHNQWTDHAVNKYPEFVKYQQQYVASKVGGEARRYWLDKIQHGASRILSIGGNFADESARNRCYTWRIPDAIWNMIKVLSTSLRVTNYVVLLAAFQIVLARYSGQQHFNIGTISDGRKTSWKDSLGYFINPIIIEACVTPASTLSTFIRAVHNEVLTSLSYRDYPYEALLKDLSQSHQPANEGLFNVLFNFYHSPLQSDDNGPYLKLGEDLLRKYPISRNSAQYDLSLNIAVNGNQLQCTIESSESFAEDWKIRQFAHHFTLLLNQFNDGIEQSMACLANQFVENDRQLSLSQGLKNKPSPFQRIDQLVSKIAINSPNKTAIVFDNVNVQYSELECLVNANAQFLRQNGVTPDDFVLVNMMRSHYLPILLLAIMKTGATYIPVDPSTPMARLNKIVREHQIKFAVVDDELDFSALGATCFKPQKTVPLVTSESEVDRVNVEASLLNSAGLAYAIFTSGSTGEPKGVKITHQAVINLLLSLQDILAIDDSDTVLASTSVAFDISVLELFLPLVVGAKLVMTEDNALLAPKALEQIVDKHKVTLMQATPSTWRVLTEYWSPKLNLKVLSGGEMLSESLADCLCSSFREVWNMYGPTETTVWSTVSRVMRGQRPICIGQPIHNTSIHILNDVGEPVPFGCVGYLYIGGDGVSPGYLNREQLTRERFIQAAVLDENRLSTNSKSARNSRSTLYNTGDLVRFLDEKGQLICLGRSDAQIKIRGYRVELGEIEAALMNLSQISMATVVVLGKEDNACLLAYYTTHDQQAIEDEQLRRLLGDSLMSYMIPSRYIHLERFPLTVSGKVDRQVLSDPQNLHFPFDAVAIDANIQLSNPIQSWLLARWRHHGLEVTGVNEPFYSIGGHSLLAIRLVGEIEVHFSVNLGIRRFIELETIENIADYLESIQQDSLIKPANSVKSTQTFSIDEMSEAGKAFPLTEIQRSYWLGRESGMTLGNVGAYLYWEFDISNLDVNRLEQAWNRLIERHPMLRVVVNEAGKQEVLAQIPFYPIQIRDLSHLEVAQQTALIDNLREELSHQVFDPSQWPLFHISTTKLDSHYRLHMGFDLLVTDAWSIMAIISEELGQLYLNPETILPKVSYSFARYLAEREQYLTPERLAKSADYWQQRINTLPAGPELPLAKTPDQISQPRFQRKLMTLDTQTSANIKHFADQNDVSLSILFMAVFAKILGIWSRRKRFTLNLTLFNRIPLHQDVDKLVGDFTSLLLLEVDLTEEGSFKDLLSQIKAQLLTDLDHRWIDGVQIAREVMKDRGQIETIFPVVFTSLLNQGNAETKSSFFEKLCSGLEGSGGTVFSLSQTPQVWLDHQLMEINGCLVLSWDVVSELFPDNMIEAMFAVYQTFVESLSQHDIAKLDFSNVSSYLLQQQSMLIPPPVLETVTPDTLSLHGLFIEQVKNNPSATAIVIGDISLSYQELFQRAANLSDALQNKGVARGSVVAVCMEKSWEQVVAVLGILLSGAAYLPLSMQNPKKRNEIMLSNAEAKWVVTRQADADVVQLDVQNVDIIVLASDIIAEKHIIGLDSSLRSQSATMHDYGSQQSGISDTLAYIIYTSGSTGQPKGVMINHQGAVNTLLDINTRFSITKEDRLFALSDLSFDLSVYDIFGTLAAGACIVMPEAAHKMEPQHWLALMTRYRVSVWNSVPALMGIYLQQLVRESVKLPTSLRLILLSGDWIPINLAKTLVNQYPDIQTVSLGGATEASIWSVIYPIKSIHDVWRSIPYGKSMYNQNVYIIDAKGKITPSYAIGNIYIGGVGLAIGYCNDTERTEAAFINHPHLGRLYKTGDMGRYLPDGNIEFLGREDNQVKLNGYRIELGDIESVVSDLAYIEQVAVIAEGPLRRQKLVCYIKLNDQYERLLEGRLKNAKAANQQNMAQLPLMSLTARAAEIKLPIVTKSTAEKRVKQTNKPPLDRLLVYLSELNCLLIEGNIFPKYQYASAGGLYPVQVYLSVSPQGELNATKNSINSTTQSTDLVSGLYYYHSYLGQLIRVGRWRGTDDRPAIELLLVGCCDAIEPVYGDWSAEFMSIEAGAIRQLLLDKQYDYGMSLTDFNDDLNIELLPPNWNASSPSSYRLLHSMALNFDVTMPTTFGDNYHVLPIEPDYQGSSAIINELLDHYKINRPSSANLMDLKRKIQFRLQGKQFLPFLTGKEPYCLGKHPPIYEPNANVTVNNFSLSFNRKFIERRSYRRFEDAPVSIQTLANWLSTFRELTNQSSAGHMLPCIATISLYIYVPDGGVDTIPSGVYIYQPVRQSLLPIAANSLVPQDFIKHAFDSQFDKFKFALFFIASINPDSLIEGLNLKHKQLLFTGSLCQALESRGPEMNLGSCQVGSIDGEQVRHVLGLASNQYYLHSLVGGGISEAQKTWDGSHKETTYYEIAHEANKALTENGIGRDYIHGIRMQQQKATELVRLTRIQERVRERFKHHLPGYMQPNDIYNVSKIPLSSNGKVDRKQLHQFIISKEIKQNVVIAPKSATEKRLLAIWQDILKTDAISTEQSFFDVGGTSVSLIEMHGILCQQFACHLPITVLFRHNTIGAMADYLDTTQAAVSPSGGRTKSQGRRQRTRNRVQTRERRSINTTK